MCVLNRPGLSGSAFLVLIFCSSFSVEKKRDSERDSMKRIALEFLNDSSAIKKQPLPILQKEIRIEGRQNVSETDKGKRNEKMSDKGKDGKSPRRKLAMIIGGSLLLMAVVSAFTVPALSGLFVAGNTALTALNVTSNFGRFTGAVAGWVGIGLLDVAASIGIYKYHKKDKPKLAKLTGGLRLLYSAILGVGIAQLFRVSSSSSAASIYNNISGFNKFWEVGLITFGLHLIGLGIMHKKKEGKKWVSVAIRSLLIIAGAGYVIQYTGMLFAANPLKFAAFIEPVFIVPMILGEITYAIWMMIKGGKKSDSKN